MSRTHTYSIVAIDRKSGRMGIGVQSHSFSVGSIVPWAEQGVGVIATQADVESSHGRRGLSYLKVGDTPRVALSRLLTNDVKREARQIAILDTSGDVAVHTGKDCIAWAGSVAGSGFGVQANLADNPGVLPAMAATFNSTNGDLADRLLQTLQAGEKAGGDARGRQSAALRVVSTSAEKVGNGWGLVDLRVEDNPSPLEELKRLLRIHIAYWHMDEADRLEAENDFLGAARQYRLAVKTAPEKEELKFWSGVFLVRHGRPERGAKLLNEALRVNESFDQVLHNLRHPHLSAEQRGQADRVVSGNENGTASS